MISELRSYSFWTPLLLFTIHQILQKLLNLPIPFADNYLDPFCFGTICLHFFQIEQKYLFKKEKLNLLEITIMILFLGSMSEIVFPVISNQFIADIFDFIAIISGAFWFILTSKKTKRSFHEL
jgi:hypothetical protein